MEYPFGFSLLSRNDCIAPKSEAGHPTSCTSRYLENFQCVVLVPIRM